MLIIVGGAVGGGCVLLICVITLVSLCCRHTGKGELNGQYGQEGQQPILLRTFPFKSFPFVSSEAFDVLEPNLPFVPGSLEIKTLLFSNPLR